MRKLEPKAIGSAVLSAVFAIVGGLFLASGAPANGFFLTPEKLTVHLHGKDVPDGGFGSLDAKASIQLGAGQERTDFIVDPEALTVEVQLTVAIADQIIADEALTLAIKGKDGKKWEFKRPKGELLPPVKQLNFDWKKAQTARVKLEVDRSALSAGLTSESEPKVGVEITLGSAGGAQATASFVVSMEDFDKIAFREFRKR